ncbi:MAG: PAS domain S-box protein [Syntrophothermus sp.]
MKFVTNDENENLDIKKNGGLYISEDFILNKEIDSQQPGKEPTEPISKSLLRSGIFKKFPDVLLVIDIDGFIINYYSNHKENVLGDAEINSYVGRNIYSLVPREVGTRIYKTILKTIDAKITTSLEYSNVSKNIRKIFEARFLPPKDNNILVIVREITRSKRAEEALRISEIRFRSVWENSLDGMRLVDLNGNIVAVNTAFCNLVEMSSEELVGQPYASVYKDIKDEPMDDFLNHFRQRFVNRDIQDHFETYVNLFSGKKVYLEVTNVFVDSHEEDLFEGEVLLLSLFRDITERKRAEEKLRESEARYRTLVETSPDAIILMDEDGKILMANKQLADTYGIKSSDEFSGISIFKFISSKDRKRIKEDIEEVVKHSKIKNSEYCIVHPKRRYIPVEVNASVTSIMGKPRIIAIIRDITERKIAIEALKNSEIQFRSVWQSSIDGMCLTNSRGKIVASNNVFCKITEHEESELKGKYYFEAYGNDTQENNLAKLERYKKKFATKTFEPFRVMNAKFKDGRDLELEVTHNLIEFEKNAPLLLTIYHDVTEKKKAEENLRKTEKLVAIGKMAAYLSHEIKTPLASIKLNIEMLEKSLILPDNKQKSFLIIQKEIKRLSKLLKNVLQFSKQTDLVFVNINLENLMDSIFDLYENLLNQKNIEFINNLSFANVYGDYQKLQTVFMHLFENSIDAMEEGGILEVYSHFNNNILDVFVKDSGPGISNGEHIFDPFFTTKNTGTGLGLSIAQKIIEQHNGKISLLSSKKGETIFKISFYNRT